MSDLESALTTEEWARMQYRDGSSTVSFELPHEVVAFCYPGGPLALGMLPQLIAAANAALKDDDPRKITRADVALLQQIASDAKAGLADGDYYRGGYMPCPDDDAVRHLAAKLAALLPPE